MHQAGKDPYDDLYEFQKEGVDQLVKLGSGFLWDDPGLGKTRQAIIAAYRLGGGPILVVCPNALKLWWSQEIRHLYPHSSVVVAGTGGRFGSKNQHPLPYREPGQKYPRWWIVHYTGVRLNEKLRTIRWYTVILDECHYIKNRKAARTVAVFDITPKYAYRIGLTATPFGNNPADVWAQLRWSAPHVSGLRSYWRFFNTFVEYEYVRRGTQRYREIKGAKNLDLLGRVMAAYGMRRSKRDVAPQLPPITDTRVPLELSGVQAQVYRQLRNKANVEINTEPLVEPIDTQDGAAVTTSITGSTQTQNVGHVSNIIVRNALARLIKMEQWLSHPWTFNPQVKGAKLEWLEQFLESCKDQAVIATRFKESSRFICEMLKEQGRARNPITGDISVRARNGIIKDWKDGKHQYLVGTIDTIGIGFSFENAHQMIMYDQLWSSIKMIQARERIHRITSKHPVQIIYPFISGTTNEIILKAFNSNYRQIELVREFIKHVRD